jgi:hypothetical protein
MGPHRALAPRTLLASSLLVALAAAWLPSACSSTAHGTDACKQIESARCTMLASSKCDTDLDNPFQGTADSCGRFYDVQCGRGLQDGAREPTAAELTRCLGRINGDCAIAREPLNAAECSVFLSPPPAPGTDTGVVADSAPSDTTPAADTAPAVDTTPVDTAPVDAGTDSD